MASIPNILWICTDQQRADTIGAFGNPVIRTPNLDALCRAGVSFDRAYCQNPLCSPSRASFLTGRYPRTTGVRQNGQSHFPDTETLVTKLLSDEADYHAGLVGKLHLSAAGGRVEPRPADGYVDFRWSHESQQHPETRFADHYDRWLRRKGVVYENLYDRHGDVFPGLPEEYHHTTWAVDEAVDFIRSAPGPWLLSLNLYDPHPPFDPPADYFEPHPHGELPGPKYREGELEGKPLPQQIDHCGARGGANKAMSFADMSPAKRKEAIGAYYGMVELLDRHIGRLLDALESSGQRDDTLVIFMSDHGEMLGDHGIFFKGPYFYEELVRVPLIVSWPGVLSGGRRSDALVELVDIAPTLCEAAGVEIPPGMQGRSLWPLLRGERDDHRDSVYCEYYNTHTRYEGKPVYATMIRTNRHKLVRYHGTEWGELYDLERDPEEFDNIYDRAPELRYELLCRAFDRSIHTMDPLPRRISIW